MERVGIEDSQSIPGAVCIKTHSSHTEATTLCIAFVVVNQGGEGEDAAQINLAAPCDVYVSFHLEDTLE